MVTPASAVSALIKPASASATTSVSTGSPVTAAWRTIAKSPLRLPTPSTARSSVPASEITPSSNDAFSAPEAVKPSTPVTLPTPETVPETPVLVTINDPVAPAIPATAPSAGTDKEAPDITISQPMSPLTGSRSSRTWNTPSTTAPPMLKLPLIAVAKRSAPLDNGTDTPLATLSNSALSPDQSMIGVPLGSKAPFAPSARLISSIAIVISACATASTATLPTSALAVIQRRVPFVSDDSASAILLSPKVTLASPA